MLSKIKILIAEDNLLNQKIAKFVLQKQNADVATVPNGNAAIAHLRENHVDVILMDIQMPELDGYETTQFIRQQMHSNIPIIALSASNLDDDARRCMDAGMNACISKPFDLNELSELILRLIEETKSTTRKIPL